MDNTGLGASGAVVSGANVNPNRDDSDFDQYRKRMMLAYKFRPNPMVIKFSIFFIYKYVAGGLLKFIYEHYFYKQTFETPV